MGGTGIGCSAGDGDRPSAAALLVIRRAEIATGSVTWSPGWIAMLCGEVLAGYQDRSCETGATCGGRRR